MCTYKLKTHHFNAAIISSGENTSPGNGIRGRPKTSYNVQRSFDKLLFNATFQINKSDQNKNSLSNEFFPDISSFLPSQDI